jgi:hypothetical protein
MEPNSSPFSPRTLLAALLVTVAGGIIVAIIAGEGRFAPSPGSEGTVEIQTSQTSSGSEPGEDKDKCLATPKLLSPADSSRLNTLIPTLRWELPANVPCRVDISTAPNFVDTVQTQDNRSSNARIMEFMPISNLQPSTHYYWRVTFLCGDWSSPDVRMGGSASAAFTTGSAGVILPPPVPIMPLEGSTLGREAFFQWSPVYGAKGYLISTGSYGAFFPELGNGIDTHYHRIVEDKPTSFRWSVAAFNDYAIGEFSPSLTYTAGNESPK